MWDTTTVTSIHKLSRLQRKLVRIHPLFQRLGLLHVEDMYNYNLCLMSIREKKENSNILTNIGNLAVKGSSGHFTRKPEIWKVDFCRTNYAAQTLKHCIPSLLNFYLSNNIDILQLNTRQLKEVFLQKMRTGNCTVQRRN